MCQHYHTSIGNIINCNFGIDNTDRAACAVSEDVCSKITLLNEQLQCRDEHLRLSSRSFNGNDIERLINSICTSRQCTFYLIFVLSLFCGIALRHQDSLRKYGLTSVSTSCYMEDEARKVTSSCS